MPASAPAHRITLPKFICPVLYNFANFLRNWNGICDVQKAELDDLVISAAFHSTLK